LKVNLPKGAPSGFFCRWLKKQFNRRGKNQPQYPVVDSGKTSPPAAWPEISLTSLKWSISNTRKDKVAMTPAALQYFIRTGKVIFYPTHPLPQWPGLF
jgi:hypothetical protein